MSKAEMEGWLEEVARQLGIWAMKHGGCVSWMHDPEDRYGGRVECYRDGIELLVSFDQEHKTLEVSQSEPRDHEYLRECVKTSSLCEVLEKFHRRGWLAHRKDIEDKRKAKEEESVANEDAARTQAEEWAANSIPGVTTGKVVESFGMINVITCCDFGLKVETGDPVWILTKKPNLSATRQKRAEESPQN